MLLQQFPYGNFLLYDDDGLSNAYREGDFRQTQFEFVRERDHLTRRHLQPRVPRRNDALSNIKTIFVTMKAFSVLAELVRGLCTAGGPAARPYM